MGKSMSLVWLSIPRVDFGISFLKKGESEHEFFFGAIAFSILTVEHGKVKHGH
jgi:hypothetical protein